MGDVELDLEELRALNGTLKQVLVDFAGLPAACEALADAIGEPEVVTPGRGDGRLADAALQFHVTWMQHRDELANDLFAVQRRAEAIIESFTGFDEQASHDVRLQAGDAARID